MNIVALFLKPALFAFLFSVFGTFLVIKFARTLGILDNPKKRVHPATLHTRPTPRGGGLSIYVAILAASLLFIPSVDQRLLGILIGGAIIVLVGYLDDRRDVSPYWRLVGQTLAALVVVGSGIGISFVSNPFGGGVIDLSQPQIQFDLFGSTHTIWVLSSLFGLVWIVALSNAVSWSSGVDGQLSGFTTIAALVITILSFRFSADITQWPETILGAIVFGAFLGFLPHHIYPQKIMPGFSGGTLAGYSLAVLSILTTAKVGTLLLVLAIPVIDAGYIIIRRLISGKSPVQGDQGHLHHRLLKEGWTQSQVAYFYWAITGVLGVAALYLNATHKLYTIVGITLAVGFLIIWLASRSEFLKLQDLDNG
ncbi:MAG: MraY family glycosyltransferase [Patescibacteria group bacterium]